MKITNKRQIILDTLKNQGLCSAQSLASLLPDIDQATVYRNLDLFVQEGLVKKYHFQTHEAMYEYFHGNHHHAVCNDCNKIIHFNAPDKEVIKLLDLKEDFTINSLDIVVHGSCNS